MKLIILDRDGVINQDSESFIKTPDEWIPIAGSLEAIAILNQSGYRVVVASNQSGLARGLLNMDTLNAIHRKMHEQLERVGGHIDGIFFCPHSSSDGCSCRKPKTGLLEQATKRFITDSGNSIPVVGDSLRDLQAAERFGGRPILVLTGKGEKTQEKIVNRRDIPTYKDLSEVVKELLISSSLEQQS